ncbi:MAG: hypothetical protein J7L89_00650 [Bacteroidales bacterium]|nr:hypothetical protein [Bacteroidales bacterium]
MKWSFLHTRLILFAVILMGIGLTIRIFFPPYYNLRYLTAATDMTPYELFNTYTENPPYAHSLYTDKVILLEGTVAGRNDAFITMGSDMRIVKCVFRKSIYDHPNKLKIGDKVIIKGVCRGITLTEILLTHCIVISNQRGG